MIKSMEKKKIPKVIKGSGVDLLSKHIADGGIANHVRMKQRKAKRQQPASKNRPFDFQKCYIDSCYHHFIF